MEIERKCLLCRYAAKDGNTNGQLALIGHERVVCLANPPTATAVLSGGGVAIVTSYPQVNKDSISCGMFAVRPVMMGVQHGNA